MCLLYTRRYELEGLNDYLIDDKPLAGYLLGIVKDNFPIWPNLCRIPIKCVYVAYIASYDKILSILIHRNPETQHIPRIQIQIQIQNCFICTIHKHTYSRIRSLKPMMGLFDSTHI